MGEVAGGEGEDEEDYVGARLGEGVVDDGRDLAELAALPAVAVVRRRRGELRFFIRGAHVLFCEIFYFFLISMFFFSF